MPQPVKPLPLEDLEHVLEHTRPYWELLRGERIFVTGATGFFGMWLLETFAFANAQLDLRAELVGLTRDSEGFRAKAPHLVKDSAITLHQGDVRNFEFPAGKFSHVIHAGTTSSAPVPHREMLDTIIQGTTRTLDFAVSAGVKRFLFISSGAVYGKQSPEMTHIPESYTGGPDTMDPASAYAEGKRVGELLCSIFSKEHGIETIVARCFAFVGPHLPLDAHFAIGNFIRDAMAGKTIQIKGDGSPVRSYLYAADLGVWLWTLLFKGESGKIFNVGSNHPISIAELAHLIAKEKNCSLSINRGFSPQSCNNTISRRAVCYYPNVDKAYEKIGLNVWIPLQEAIRKTFDWTI
jgi:dTDP-glucose 4,6-dehydratase